MAGITIKQKEDFSEWYQQVVKEADLAESSVVRGCMVIKPYGYALWEQIQKTLDGMIKAAGVQNAYFPLFIPKEFIEREAKHVEGFAPELLTITHVGDKELSEKLVVRPTSETIMYDTFANWIHSYRDLPLLINQWANVVRWEKRTRLFLRTTEFLWQEGHTVHASYEEAAKEVERALNMYEKFAKEVCAVHVIPGKKTREETFAGAEYTKAIEGLMKDGKALQMGTSHHLGDGFAKVFGIQYSDKDGTIKYPYQTSWGVSTRLIGGIIMAHGDDKGLRLPPKIAPIQVVIIPIYKDDSSRAASVSYSEEIKNDLILAGVRVHVDDRDYLTPGFKFNEYELKGVPIRIEVGPKDIEKKSAVLVDRFDGVKTSVPRAGIISGVISGLDKIQKNLYEEHKSMVEKKTIDITSYDEFKEKIEEGGFLRVWWCDDEELEKKIKEDTKATIRCIITDNTEGSKKCFYTGKKASFQVLFARSY